MKFTEDDIAAQEKLEMQIIVESLQNSVLAKSAKKVKVLDFTESELKSLTSYFISDST